ncbi:histidinol-phosphate aminotransferase [Desulfonema ishimotonii]|uniref:Histidinol-phosphate aminotransferase n=1 Tax=Desulfonema ishimotonii TaxID=45657 RepID=A0A401G2W7_9BACT|nr:threonine-phosphate decarboxylase [Desulfonema ishimotonii]GBC63567.1 histidinol-phosphate aminotransferase [Desulfonema ishimotonii]
MISGHGGNIYKLAQDLNCAPSDIIDMSSNVNPLGPPPGLVTFLRENILLINALPEVDASSAISAFADRYDTDPQLVVPGNGTTQLIHTIPLALKSRRALILGPTYADYADACIMHGVHHEFFFADPRRAFAPDMAKLTEMAGNSDTVFICNPDNPTGHLIPRAELMALCRACPETFFVIDESYLPFVADDREYTMLRCGLPNVMILNSMSKIFRVPGLRIGFLVSSGPIVRKMNRYGLPWSLNSLAQAAVVYLMENREEIGAFVRQTRTALSGERQYLAAALGSAPGIRLFPSTTSFVLAELSGAHTAESVCAALAEERILIRNCANFQGLSDRFIRISLKTPEINRLLAGKLSEILAG